MSVATAVGCAPWFSRACLGSVLALGLAFSSFLSWRMWRHMDESPTTTSLVSLDHSPSGADFPAVTVCANVDEFFLHKTADSIRQRFNLTSSRSWNGSTTFQPQIDPKKEIKCSDIIGQLGSLNRLIQVSWNLFGRIRTEVGHCCVFHSRLTHLVASEWPMQNQSLSSNLTNPRLAQRYQIGGGFGADSGLIVTLKPSDGYRLVVHNPWDFPRLSEHGLVCEANHSCLVTIQVTMITSTSSISSMDVRRRQCLFGDERPLRYFPKYTLANCRLQWIIDAYIEQCRCLPIAFADIVGAERTVEFCHLANGTDGCVYGINRMQRNCNYRHDCLPLCDHVYYDAVVTRLAGPRATKALSTTSGTPLTLQVFIRNPSCVLYRRHAVHTWEDFLSNVGGAFGLGVGANLLNIIRAVLAAVVHVWRLVARSGNAAARSGNVAGVGSVAP